MHHIIDTNKEIPQPDANALDIVALVKDSGRVTGYELSDGRVVSRNEGVEMARDRLIKDVAIAENKGTEYLRSLPDNSDANNIGSLPTRTMDSFFMNEDWDEDWENWEFDMSGENSYGDSAFWEPHLNK
ncbi:MAG: DUF3892 domain-containing protein [Peptococcaceae bacterium]|nr:DUF3892 domain-containing protein [Peptococcaceae bacterium]